MISLASDSKIALLTISSKTLPITGGQKFECPRCAARRFQQTLALRIFANGFEQAEERMLQARDPRGAAARNLADSTFSRLQLSFGFGVPSRIGISLPQPRCALR